MEKENLSVRSSQQVFEDHLKLTQQGRLEEDLKQNNAEDIVLLTNCGTYFTFKSSAL